VSDKN